MTKYLNILKVFSRSYHNVFQPLIVVFLDLYSYIFTIIIFINFYKLCICQVDLSICTLKVLHTNIAVNVSAQIIIIYSIVIPHRTGTNKSL